MLLNRIDEFDAMYVRNHQPYHQLVRSISDFALLLRS